ncbi:MAG: hypothetical protein OXC63_11415, partial [Aestuariivita sp.]|nr:hypothetical protein [Aestuariivita sp.]
ACCLLFVASEVYTTTKQKSITTEPDVCSELDTSIPQFDIFEILERPLVSLGRVQEKPVVEGIKLGFLNTEIQ